MRQSSKNSKNAIFVSSTLSVMNPLLSSSATCVAQGKWVCNLHSQIDFIADFSWYGRGGEQRKYERKERGVGQKKKISLASTLLILILILILIRSNTNTN